MYSLIYIFPVAAFAGFISKIFIAMIRIVIFEHYLMDFLGIFGNKGNVIAKRKCLSNYGTTLATFSNQDMNTMAIQAAQAVGISSSQPVWCGLNDIDTEGTENMKWIDGSVTPLRYWNPGEPNNNGNQDCVKIHGFGKWMIIVVIQIHLYVIFQNILVEMNIKMIMMQIIIVQVNMVHHLQQY